MVDGQTSCSNSISIQDYAILPAILNNSTRITCNTRPQFSTLFSNRPIDSTPLHLSLWIDNNSSVILKIEIHTIYIISIDVNVMPLRRQVLRWRTTTAGMTFFRSSGLPFLTVAMTISPTPYVKWISQRTTGCRKTVQPCTNSFDRDDVKILRPRVVCAVLSHQHSFGEEYYHDRADGQTKSHAKFVSWSATTTWRD